LALVELAKNVGLRDYSYTRWGIVEAFLECADVIVSIIPLAAA
jgi:hypothetical protein